MIFVSLWGIEKSVRLILGWHTHGGLIGPTALRIVGVFFLLLPTGGVFTGYYAHFGLLAVAQAIGYVILCFVLFRMARGRSQHRERHGNETDDAGS
jgi:hypothetical protein